MPFTPKTVAVLNMPENNNACAMYYANSDNNIRKMAYKYYANYDYNLIDLPDTNDNDIEITENGFYMKVANAAWAKKAYYIASA